MSGDQLDPVARSFVEEALRGEPGVGSDARSRMRSRMLVTLACVGASSTSAEPAAAATKAGAAAAATATEAGAAAASTTFAGSIVTKGVIVLLVVGAAVGSASLALRSPTSRVASRTPAGVTTTPLAATGRVAAPTKATDPEPPRAAEPPDDVTPAAVPVDSLTSVVASAPTGKPSVGVAPAREGSRREAPLAATNTEAPPLETAAAPADSNDAAFAEELALLERARRATAAGKQNEALEALARMDRLPRARAFAEEHDALRIVALCSSGRSEEGRAALSRFNAAFPRSLHTERVQGACRE